MTNFVTLAERMSAGRLPVADALRLAAVSAEQLRQMHDQGRVHGALTPSAILLTESGVEFQPAAPALTPYTAPETLEGRPADERTDIFAFGAILYEMFTGRRAFEGPEDTVKPSGSTALDRVVAGCVLKSPDARFQRAQKVQLELRLLASTFRRSPSAVTAPVPAPIPLVAATPVPVAAAAPNREMEALEDRIAARLDEQEKAVASVERVANEVLKALRGGGMSAPARPASRGYASSPDFEPEAGMGRMDRAFELLNDKVSRIDLVLGNVVDRLQKLEQQLDAFDTDAAALRDSVTRDVRNFERALKAQSTAIESARTAMGQTDDLVERVVEALDSLQSMFITNAEERAAS